MENFRRKLRRRMGYGLGYCALVVGLLVAATVTRQENHATSFALGFGCGLLFVALAFIVKYRSALTSEAKLRQLYIEETDERRRHINEKIGGVGINVSIASLSLAMLISNYYNQTIFLTLLAVTLFIVLLKATLGFYYDKTI